MNHSELLSMVEDLNQSKVYPSHVAFETIQRNQTLEIQKMDTHIVIILEGCFHLENKTFQILQFFVPGNVIHQSPYKMGVHDQLRLISDSETQVAFVNREFFLNFASNKIEYMEWLLNAVTENSSAFCFELMKFDLPTDKRIIYTLQTFCQKVEAPEINGYFEIPSFITKTMLSKYGGVSRKTLDKILINLVNQNLLKREDGNTFVKSHL
ncbi:MULTISPECIES: Crp/Fnr family transcriptional regulator [unclassified Listeria]|nr:MULTISPECIES: Crp/Fnr family transcriptional regulator [unclassified Listeria]